MTKWLIVVLFNTMAGDVYIFTEPTFSTRDTCMSYIMNREKIPGLVQKLTEEYKTPMPILAVNCLEEQQIKDILSGVGKTST
jgi:hypothetical protein